MSPALEIDALEVRRGARVVLQGVSLRADPGTITSVLGPNGAGKSTLLRAVAGLLDHSGSVRIQGRDAATLDREARAQLITFVPQSSQLNAAMSVRDVVAQGRYAHRHAARTNLDRDADAITRAMEHTDVLSLATRLYTELSFGEQRRVLLARALSTGAKVLLLDEPTAALDVAHALSLHALLHELLALGHAVIAVLHDIDAALTHTDHALLLKDGKRVAAGPTRDVLTPEAIRHVYGVEAVVGGGLGFRLPERAL